MTNTTKSPFTGEDAMTLAEAAKTVGMSVSGLTAAINSGRLKAFKVSQVAKKPKWYVTDRNLQEFLTKGIHKPNSGRRAKFT